MLAPQPAAAATAHRQAFEAFKQRWLEQELPAWLAVRNASMEQYRALTGSRKRPTHAARSAEAEAAAAARLGWSAAELPLEEGSLAAWADPWAVEEGELEASEEELLAAVA